MSDNNNDGGDTAMQIDLADYVDEDARGEEVAELDVAHCVQLLRGEIVESGHTVHQNSLACFQDQAGQYQTVVNTRTTWVNDFTRFWLPSYDAFSWLSPYMGNAHNRSFFTQLVLYVVSRAKHRHNRDYLPDVYEPFVGSGQIFMGAVAFADLLLEDAPFDGLSGGDLNRHLIVTYQALKTPGFVEQYLTFAFQQDHQLEGAPGLYKQHLDALNNYQLDDANRFAIANRYTWLVNRCAVGAKLAADGGLRCNLRKGANLFSVRIREKKTLPRVAARVQDPLRYFAIQDFAATTHAAAPKDIVVMDCPFPVFDWNVPPPGSGLVCQASHTYGTDDGAPLQLRIVNEVVRLIRQGTTVLLCNFANPDLILAYASVLQKELGIHNTADYIYTYKSPGTDATVYQLVLFPGAKVDMSGVPDTIRRIWDGVTGNQNFAPVAEQEEKMSSPEPTDDTDTSDSDYEYVPKRKRK